VDNVLKCEHDVLMYMQAVKHAHLEYMDSFLRMSISWY